VEQLKDIVTRAAGLHDRLAETVGEATLSCEACKRVEHPTREQVAEYFRKGWPKCCGRTMALETRRS
jgi:hypothetical protein